MLLKHLKPIWVMAFLLMSGSVFSQSTFQLVDNIFKSNCTGSCHAGASPSGQLPLDGTLQNTYNALVGVNPVNPFALGQSQKRVFPGDPRRSFLFRKLDNGFLDAHTTLDVQEGSKMPKSAPQLANNEIELVRQWIMQGAPLTGNVVDTSIVNRYYRDGGITASPANHPLPTAPGSFQVHLGKVFLGTTSEAEYFIKYDPQLPDTLEVNRIELFMTGFAHHFIIYKFQPGKDSLYPAGLRLQNPTNGNGSSTGNNEMVSAWQSSANYDLPPGTAYQWDLGTILDMNYHLRNSNVDSVMATDIYFNVYTQPKGTALKIMYSDLIQNFALLIPPLTFNYEITKADFFSGETNFWNIWLLSSHTHKLGIDFDIFERNANGSVGNQIFEGFYNIDYSFNQGYYDWAHPPIRKFAPLHQINPRNGLIMKAKFTNTSNQYVTFGLTTDKEMMLYFIQYTKGDPLITGIQEEGADPTSKLKLKVYPNPGGANSRISLHMNKPGNLEFSLKDLSGRNIGKSLYINKAEGDVNISLQDITGPISKGLYLLQVKTDDGIYTRKISYMD